MTSAEEARAPLARTLASGLWFPALFFFGFLVCYLLPFHAPAPHGVKVAVAGPDTAAALAQAFGAKAPGAFDILPAPDAAAAKQRVLDRDAVAGYADHTLYTAEADGSPLKQVVTAAFGAPKTVELVPLAPGDNTGTGLFYLAMAWNLAPYIAVMMLMRAELTRRAKLLTLVGIGVFASVVGYLIGLAVNVIPDRPLAMLYAFLLTQAVAWTAFGLAPLARQFLPGVAVLLFVLLSIPSSGGAIPYQLVPEPFRALHPVMPLGNLIDALHGVLYFANRGLGQPTLVLCLWILLGATLVGVDALRQARRERETAGSVEAEEPVEDPVLEAPRPHPVSPATRSAATPMLAGSVRRRDGGPVPGAFLTLLAASGRQLAATRTDADGRYAVAGLPEDFVAVVLLARGYAPAAARILIEPGRRHRQDFVLTPA